MMTMMNGQMGSFSSWAYRRNGIWQNLIFMEVRKKELAGEGTSHEALGINHWRFAGKV